MTDLESLLRETYDKHSPAGPVRAFTTGRTLARRRRTRVLGAAVVALLLVSAGVVLRPQSPVDRVAQRPTAVDGPTKTVTFHGIAVDVPLSFVVGRGPCGVVADRVLLPELSSLADACGHELTTTSNTVVRISEADGQAARPVPVLTGRSSTVDGAAVVRGQTGRVLIALFPSVDTIVTVDGPVPSVSQAIVRSARPFDLDPNGCSRSRDTVNPGDTNRPSGGAVLPGGQTVSAVCRYTAGVLTSSTALDETRTQSLVDLLRRLPVGRGHVGGRLAYCSHRVTDGDVLRVAYRDQPTFEVFAHPDACGTLAEVTNGPAVLMVTDAFRAAVAPTR